MTAPRTRRGLALRTLSIAIAGALAAPAAMAQTLPSGFGSASNVTAPTTVGNTMTVDVTAPRAYAEWISFDIANGYTFEVTNTSTPDNYIFVNRVTGGNFSNLAGSLQANGNIWLLNPNGIVVGNGAVLDVGGLLLSTATTLNGETEATNGAAFLSGTGQSFWFTGAAGSVFVEPGAVIAADTGAIAMLANAVNISGGQLLAGGDVAIIGAQGAEIGFDADLNAVSYLTLNVGSNQGTGISISGTPAFAGGRTFIAATGMADNQGNILLTDDNAANDIDFQSGDVVLFAGRATSLVGGQVAYSNGVIDQGAGAGAKVSIDGTLSTPAALHVYAGRGIGSADSGLAIDAAGTLRLYSDAKGSDVAVRGGTSITTKAIQSRDDIVLRSEGDITTGQLSSGATVDANAARDATGVADELLSATITGYDVDVVAGTGARASVDQVVLGLNGDYRISAGDFMGSGTLNPVYGSGTTNGFSITDTSGGFTLGFDITTPGDFSLSTTNGGGLTTFSHVVSTSGDVSIDAGTGDLSLGGNVTAGAAGTVHLGGNRVAQTAGVVTTNALDVSAVQGISLAGLNQFASGDFANSGTGNVNVLSSVAGVVFGEVSTGSGNVQVRADNGLTLEGAEISTGNGDVEITGDVAVSGVNTVTADLGSVTFFHAVDGAAVAGSLSVTSDTGTLFSEAVGGTAALAALTVDGASSFEGLTARTTGAMDLDDATVVGTGAFTFQAGGRFDAASVTSASAPLQVNANGIGIDTLDVGNSAPGVYVQDAVLDAGTGDLVLGEATAASLTVAADGDFEVTDALNTYELGGVIGGAATLDGDNAIDAIADFSSNGLVLHELDGLDIDGDVDSGTGDARIEVADGVLKISATGVVRGNDIALSAETFTNASGADALDAAGNWVVYQTATSPNGTYDDLDSGNTAIWGETIATLAPSSITDDRYVFSFSPTLTFTTTDTTKTYGTDISGSAGSLYVITGYQAAEAGAYLADTATSVFSGAPGVTSDGFADDASVAGGPYAIDIASGTLAALNGYQFAFDGAGAVTVDAKALSGTATATTKTYDGSTAGTGTISLPGVLAGDDVGASGTFTFADKNAGTDKTVTISGATLSGTDAGNYTLTVPASTLGDILQKAITGAGAATDKTYDGTMAGSGTITLSGVVAGDDLAAGGTFTFADENAGTGKTVTLSGVSLTGADAGNYTLTVPASVLGDILQKAISGTVSVSDKTYDGTTAGTGTVALSGIVAGDDVAGSATFAFADRNAGTDKTVTVSGATLSGADAGNYTVTLPASALADILQKALTGTATATGKTYDGTTSGSGTIGLTGVVAGDDVDAGGTFTFADRNAGTGKTVTVTGATLGGADAGNYTLTVPTTVLGDILQKAITGTATASNKTYDGTTAGSGNVSLAGVVAGDSVNGSAVFTFADRNAGTGKTVTVSGATLSGTDAGNYTVTLPASALADILQKAITGTATASNKTYDGTTTGAGTVSLTGVVAGDDVNGSATFTFADRNAGTSKTVTVSGATLSGTDAGNYMVTLPASALADILQKAITGTATASNKTYDGTTAGSGTVALTGVVVGDDVDGAATFTFADKNAGTDKTVNVSGATLSGTDAGNYMVTLPASTLGDILQKAITGTATASNKTYDGTTTGAGSVSLTGVVVGDDVNGSANFTFADKNAGAAKSVTISGATLSGTDAANYTMTLPASALADILQKAITGTAAASNKTYDGTTAGTGSIALAGVVAGDDVAASGSYAFSDANAGTAKTVNVSGVALGGADAGNYTVVVPGTTVADILRRAITVTANSASKPEGNPDPALAYGVTQGSLVQGESLTGSLTRDPGEAPGNYAIGQGTLDAGTNYQLTFVGSTLTITEVASDPTAGLDLDEGIGHFVRFLAGNDPTIARDRRELRVSDEREDCDAGNARSGTCGMGGPD